jgi:hypothetical protein
MSTDQISADVAPPRRRLRPVLIGALVLGVMVAAGVVAWRLTAERTTPYDDARSAGALTLCSADGERITGGKVTDRPFAAYALGETPVGEPYVPEGAVATLFGYQPREGVEASEFSGSPISRAAEYVDPERPATYVEEGAWSIADFVSAFPADLDGYVQLRLYLGVPGVGTLTNEPYDTADLRVDGDAWELVRGGDASCAGAADLLPDSSTS